MRRRCSKFCECKNGGAPTVPTITEFNHPIVYSMEPAPKSNPDGRLDGAWVIRATAHVPRGEGSTDRPIRVNLGIKARFTADGRDACERWALKHRVSLAN